MDIGIFSYPCVSAVNEDHKEFGKDTLMRTSALALLLGFALSVLLTSSSLATTLASHPDAVDGATGSQITISGGLAVTVEYAVLRADDFTTAFPLALGYTPTANELVYAYQIFNHDPNTGVPPSSVDITTQIIMPVNASATLNGWDRNS